MGYRLSLVSATLVKMSLTGTVILCSLAAFAQTAPMSTDAASGVKLTLEQCIDVALKQNMQVLLAAQRVDASEAALYGAWTNVLPRVNANILNTTRNTSGDRPRILDGVVIGNQPGGTTTTYSNGLTINQTIYNGGQSWNAIKRDRLNVESTKWDVKTTEQLIINNVKVQYYTLLRAIRLREVTLEQVKLNEEQLRRSESMFQIGSVAKVDVLQARANLGQVRITLLNQDKSVRQSQATLNNALGQDVNSPIEVVDPIGDAPLAYATPPSSVDAMRTVETNNPDVLAKTTAISTARVNRTIAKGTLWPSVTGTLNYARSGVRLRDAYSNFGKNWNMALGLGISIPIMNGTQNWAQIQQAQINLISAEETLEQTRRTTALTIKRALLDMETTRQVIELSNENIVAAEEGLRLAEERYRVGSGTLLDVFNAQLTVAQTKNNLVGARYDYLIARANLDQGLGIR